MPSDVITNLEQITTEWLTTVLTRSGALTHGAVAAFEEESRQRELSTNLKLRLTYTTASEGDMPQRLFLKTVKRRCHIGCQCFRRR